VFVAIATLKRVHMFIHAVAYALAHIHVHSNIPMSMTVARVTRLW